VSPSKVTAQVSLEIHYTLPGSLEGGDFDCPCSCYGGDSDHPMEAGQLRALLDSIGDGVPLVNAVNEGLISLELRDCFLASLEIELHVVVLLSKIYSTEITILE
jgi:hypothetical protein